MKEQFYKINDDYSYVVKFEKMFVFRTQCIDFIEQYFRDSVGWWKYLEISSVICINMKTNEIKKCRYIGEEKEHILKMIEPFLLMEKL